MPGEAFKMIIGYATHNAQQSPAPATSEMITTDHELLKQFDFLIAFASDLTSNAMDSTVLFLPSWALLALLCLSQQTAAHHNRKSQSIVSLFIYL